MFLITIILGACAGETAPRTIPTSDVLLMSQKQGKPVQPTPYYSKGHHLTVALPAGWSAAEDAGLLAGPFTGLVSFNSWGALDFWSPRLLMSAEQLASYAYNPQSILENLPSGGAYIVLLDRAGIYEEPNAIYGPEYQPQTLSGIWAADFDCRKSGSPLGYNGLDLIKWGRFLRLEVYCAAQVTDQTASEVSQIINSWSFDAVPAGDPGWASVYGRLMLPPAAQPGYYPILTGLGRKTNQEGASLYTTETSINEQMVRARFIYQWDQTPDKPFENCPPEHCHSWLYEGLPSGQILLVSESGADLPDSDPPAPASGELSNRNIWMQMENAPSYSYAEDRFPYGRFPVFTLYDDGTVIYSTPSAVEGQFTAFQVRLSNEQAAMLRQQVIEDGFERLGSYPYYCYLPVDGQGGCNVNASYTILQVRLPDAELRQVISYGDYTNSPETLSTVRNLMATYQNSAAVPYAPHQAGLFLRKVENAIQGQPIYSWPFDPTLLEPPPGKSAWAIQLNGQPLQSLLANLPANLGHFYFTANGVNYQANLVPWLPGVDYSEEISNY